jgi:hypothetical protein
MTQAAQAVLTSLDRAATHIVCPLRRESEDVADVPVLAECGAQLTTQTLPLRKPPLAKTRRGSFPVHGVLGQSHSAPKDGRTQDAQRSLDSIKVTRPAAFRSIQCLHS